MGSFLGIGLPAVANIAGTIIGNMQKANSSMALLERQAELQKELWTYQQQNAHQYEVQDLKNAGLNPILSANHSQLANMPSVSTPQGNNPLEGVSEILTSALEMQQRKQEHKDNLEIEAYKQEIDMLKARTEMFNAQTMKEHWEREDEMRKSEVYYQGINTASQVKLREAQINDLSHRFLMDFEKNKAEIMKITHENAISMEQLAFLAQQTRSAIAQADIDEATRDKLLGELGELNYKLSLQEAKDRYWTLTTYPEANKLGVIGRMMFQGLTGAQVRLGNVGVRTGSGVPSK